jgi:alkylhydroperoxidase family enzyme
MARVPYVDETALPREHQDLLVSALQGKPLNIYRAVGNNPDALYGLRTFLGALWRDSGLDPDQRELVILAVAHETKSAYEWHQHVAIARDVGLSDSDILAIADGDLDQFDRSDKTLIQYALAVVRDAVDDDCHAALAARHGPATVVGVTALASGYLLIARLLSALAVDTETPFVGWRLENDDYR